MYGTSTPRHDRLPVPDIKTPAVRALSDVELLQRNSSIAFFRTSSGMDGLSRGPSRYTLQDRPCVLALAVRATPLSPASAMVGFPLQASASPWLALCPHTQNDVAQAIKRATRLHVFLLFLVQLFNLDMRQQGRKQQLTRIVLCLATLKISTD